MMFQNNSEDCTEVNAVKSVFPNTLLQNRGSFRLQNRPELTSNHSRYLMKYDFKQRIDSMFDETRSAVLESGNANRKKPVRAAQSECGATPLSKHHVSLDSIGYSDKRQAKNTVQARIEKMFADVSSSEIEDECGPPNALQQFQVDYIGSLPLLNRVTSLQGLQEPLKHLYFNYRKNEYPSSKLQVLLEISSDGLKVQNFHKNQRTVKEQLNPFPSIAVWAALKFVCRSQNTAAGKCGLEYAFLPIVVDQTSSEKSSLFRSLDQNDVSCAIEKTYDDHSPLFVVIMRQNGTSSNRLQCHGFACATSEDAIVLAANLNKALVATMSNNHMDNGLYKKRKKVKCRNGLGTVCSIAGSSVCEEQDYLYPERKDAKSAVVKREVVKKPAPPRPPRKYKQSDEEILQNGDKFSFGEIEPDEIIVIDDVNDDNEMILNEKKNLKNEKFNKNKSDDKTVSSVCSRQSVNSDKHEPGDILTKVVIPRSGSFLNATGPLSSRYNRCATNYTGGMNVSNRKNSIHSPLGFTELFNELRIHEGLNNIDEILNTIINVDGMSFNSLKPIYKEFIFKLAVTLTKDELYQRSKSIMQKQKHRKRQLFNRRRTFVSGYRIKRVFHTSFSKLKPAKYKIGLPFSTHFFPSFKKMHKSKPQFKPKKKLKRQNATSTISSNDSFVIGFSRHRRNSFKYQSNDIYKDKSFYLKRGEISFHRKKLFSSPHMQNMPFNSSDRLKHSTADEEISCLLIDEQNKSDSRCNHENVSGYVTCSECSYNSESCKYKSSKRCYCSLKNQKKKSVKPNRTGNTAQQSSVSSCSCDTDSCIESEKCYCNRTKKPSIFEQLKQQGFAASESSLSRPSSPVTAWQRNESLTAGVNRDKTCLQASKSLEFFHVHKNISRPTSILEESQIRFDQNNLFEDRIDNFPDRSENGQIQKYLGKSPPPMNNNCDDTRRKMRNNGSLNDSDYSDNDDCNFNNSENVLNNFSENYNLDESDKDNGISNGPERVHPDNRFIEPEHNKILVVSTRDQKGQVKNSVTPFYNQSMFSSHNPLKFLINENMRENDAISIKKTAEIAALFSDMKVEKKNHLNIRSNKDIIYNSFNPQKGLFWNGMGNLCKKNINLENSLGYFP